MSLASDRHLWKGVCRSLQNHRAIGSTDFHAVALAVQLLSSDERGTTTAERV